MDSLKESVPKLSRNITLGTQIEQETGIPVTRLTDYTDDDLDEQSSTESKVTFELLNNKVNSDIRLIRGFMNSIKSTEINLKGKKPIATAFLSVLDNDILIIEDYYDTYESCAACNNLINQLKNLRNELINKMKRTIGGYKKRSKKRRTNKKRGNKKRHMSRKYYTF
jgi:hypothetical protein